MLMQKYVLMRKKHEMIVITLTRGRKEGSYNIMV